MNCVSWLRSAGCALVFAMLAACSTRVAYDGQRLSASEEAVLSGGAAQETGGVTSITVADGELYINGGFSKGAGAAKLFLKPGRHSVTVVHFRYPYEAQANLWFEAAPGRRYLARAGQRNGKLMMWIEDSATGQMVGGIDDNPIPLFSNYKKD